jgi:hypothetical protein
MKHWVLNKGEFYNLKLDDDHRVISIIERPVGVMEITEECDHYFQVKMSKPDLIEALRELANELESKRWLLCEVTTLY